MESNYLDVKKLIAKNSNLIMSKQAEEKYRKEPLGRTKFPIEDFINFTVYSDILKKKLNLKTYMQLPNDKDFPNYKGILFSFHGMQSHGNVVSACALEYSKIGVVTVTYDYRGHGQSDGTNGDIEDFESIVNDSILFIESVENYFKDKFKGDNEKLKFLGNMFVEGLSMGGLMSYNVSKRFPHKFKGAILHAPAFDFNANSILKILIPLVNWCCPLMKVPRSDKPLAVKNPASFENPDPILDKTYIKLRTVSTMSKNMKQSQSEFHTYETPFVIIIPGCDKLVPPEIMLEFYEKSRSLDKQIMYYQDMWHATYVEEEIFDIVKRLVKWIDERI